MKRIAVLLLLMCILCLGCAEKQEDPALAEAVSGKWLYADASAGPVWIELLTDGSCAFSTGEQYRWKGLAVGENGVFSVELYRDKKAVYRMDVLKDSAALADMLTQQSAGSYTRVVHAPEGASQEWFGAWYASDGTVAVALLADGTCVMTDGKAEWTAVQWEEDAAQLLTFDREGIRNWVALRFLQSGVEELTVSDEMGKPLGVYYHNALFEKMLGDWVPFRKDAPSIGLRKERITVNSEEYLWKVKALDEKQITASVLEGEQEVYTLRLWMGEEYPRMEVKTPEEELLYYHSAYGHDPEDPEAIYQQTVEDMSSYLASGGFGALRENAALEDLYRRLQILGDYKDSGEYLAHFTVCENLLTRVVEYNTDPSGSISENILELYSYDENGRLISGRGKSLEEKYGISDHVVVGTMYFSYDDSGRVSSIRVGTEDTTEAVCTPVYNSKGNLSKMKIEGEETTLTVTFAYNSKNLRTRFTVPYSDIDTEYCAYTYNDAGQCTKKTVKWSLYGYTEITTYTYGESGALEEEKVVLTIVYPEMTRKTTTVYHYTYDENGNPVSAAVTTDDPLVTYAEQTVKYTYEDLYFYR